MDLTGYIAGKLVHVLVMWLMLGGITVVAKLVHWDAPLKNWLAASKWILDGIVNLIAIVIGFAAKKVVNLVSWVGRIVGAALWCGCQWATYRFQLSRARKARRRLPAPPRYQDMPDYIDHFPPKKKKKGGVAVAAGINPNSARTSTRRLQGLSILRKRCVVGLFLLYTHYKQLFGFCSCDITSV